MHCVPASTRCSPSTLASWPVTGTLPARPLAFSRATMPPAMVSFAETTPSILPSLLV
jgi:hypothetical protein